MITNQTHIDKISIPEALSLSNGKTSISAILGSIGVLVGYIYFGVGIFAAFSDIEGYENILIQSLGLVGMATSMIIVKKIKGSQDKTNQSIEDEKQS